MDQLKLLRQRADELLQTSVNIEGEHRKFEIIKNILKDDDCFLNMDVEHSYSILRDLGVNENSIAACYSSLIAR